MSIDHKAESLRLMDFNAQVGAGMTVEEIHVSAQMATAHATLYAAEQTAALVKEQRTANELRAAELMTDKPWLRADIERLGLS